MNEQIDRINAVRDLFEEVDDANPLVTKFNDYYFALRLAAREDTPPFRHAAFVAENFGHIAQNLWDAFMLASRIDITAKQRIPFGSTTTIWSSFGTLDIEFFHVKLRSIADYAAESIARIALKLGVVPDGSFEKLRNWAADPSRVAVLGADLRTLILEADWFPRLRAVRDALVHRGGLPLNFGGTPLLFQIVQPDGSSLVEDPRVMSKGFVDFRLYAAQVLVDLIRFLEALAVIIAKRHPIRSLITTSIMGPNFGVFLEWLDLYQSRLEALRDGTFEPEPSGSDRPPVHPAYVDRLAATRKKDKP